MSRPTTSTLYAAVCSGKRYELWLSWVRRCCWLHIMFWKPNGPSTGWRLSIKGKVVSMGTPASLKGNGGLNMRFELTLEPRADVPHSPESIQNTTVTGRRLIGRLQESDIASTIQWARGLKETGHGGRILGRAGFTGGCVSEGSRSWRYSGNPRKGGEP